MFVRGSVQYDIRPVLRKIQLMRSDPNRNNPNDLHPASSSVRRKCGTLHSRLVEEYQSPHRQMRDLPAQLEPIQPPAPVMSGTSAESRDYFLMGLKVTDTVADSQFWFRASGHADVTTDGEKPGARGVPRHRTLRGGNALAMLSLSACDQPKSICSDVRCLARHRDRRLREPTSRLP